MKSHSFFLFGSRGTGKTTFLEENYKSPNTLWLDLLDPELEDLFTRQPNELVRRIEAQKNLQWIVIDEIQKCPKLLNLVHQQIEKRKLKFALTGSSARRLKQKGVNLLAGRAFTQNFFPLTAKELGKSFRLEDILQWGSLPHVFSLKSNDLKQDYLRTYALNYITSEVQAEQWVRNIEFFRKFLPVAAQMNGKVLNYSKIARDVGVDSTTIASYYEILEDTLLGFYLEPYHRSVRKRQVQSSKFYLFDLGIKRALDQTLTVPLLPQTYAYGEAFEHFIICEFFRLNAYLKKDFKFSYLRTKDDAEIDLIVERPGKPTLLVEIKSKSHVEEEDVRLLRTFSQSIKNSQAIVLSNDPHEKNMGGVKALPWTLGLETTGFF